MRTAILALALAVAWTGATDAQEFVTLKGHGGPVMALDVASDGRVASASFDNAVAVWQNRRPEWLEGHGAAVNAVTFWDDGTLLSAGDDFEIRLWRRLGTGYAGRVLGRHHGKIAALATSAAANLVASASWDGTIGLWDFGDVVADRLHAPVDGDRGLVLRGHGQGVNDVAFSADGRRIYSASTDGTIRVWNTGIGEQIGTLVSHGFGINRLALNEEAGWIAYGAVDGATRLIDLATGEQIADFTLERRPILALAHHAGTAQLAVGDGEGYIMVIDTSSRQIVRDFRAMREGPVWALAFSPDGRTIWAAGLDDTVYGWPVDLLDQFDPQGQSRSFLRPAATMPNGERQFMRKCSICHTLRPGPSRKAGPSLHGVFGRRAGTLPGYTYSPTLDGSDIVWSDKTIDALFDRGPDHYVPGSKMPMQVIARPQDRADLIAYLKSAGE